VGVDDDGTVVVAGAAEVEGVGGGALVLPQAARARTVMTATLVEP
jgi:hypothetical protein